MEQADRAKIDRFCEPFSSRINMETLWPRLIANKVFNADDVNVPLWEGNLSNRDTIRDILQTIKTRGPRAFDNLAHSLRQTNQRLLADILQGLETPPPEYNIASDNDPLPNDGNDNDASIDDDDDEKLRNTTGTPPINVKKATEFCDGPDYPSTIGRYRMRSQPRGYILIITNICYIQKTKRRAAEKDEASLKKLFEEMGFRVTSKMDLTGAEMRRAIKDFSQQDFHLVDSCFVIVSAHGGETRYNGYPETEIEGIDISIAGAETVSCSEIIDFFAAENCKYLRGKPKIFIFQSCRGGSEQYPVKIESDGFVDNVPSRNYSDILVAHSTIPGHVAYRNTESGSWYIQLLCEVFMKHACNTHVQDLFNMVDRRLMDLRTYDRKSQTSTVKSIGFNKHCYLNPGLFEDS